MKVVHDESRAVQFNARPNSGVLGTIRIADFTVTKDPRDSNPVVVGQFADEAAAREFCRPWPLEIVKLEQDEDGKFQVEVAPAQ